MCKEGVLMREIVVGRVYCGNVGDLDDIAALRRAGVHAVVELAIEEPPSRAGREMIWIRIPITDGAGSAGQFVEMALRCVSSLVLAKIPVLVACSAGMSRSPSIIAGAISIAEDRDPDVVLQEVVRGASADVSNHLWHQVRSLVQQLQSRS